MFEFDPNERIYDWSPQPTPQPGWAAGHYVDDSPTFRDRLLTFAGRFFLLVAVVAAGFLAWQTVGSDMYARFVQRSLDVGRALPW